MEKDLTTNKYTISELGKIIRDELQTSLNDEDYYISTQCETLIRDIQKLHKEDIIESDEEDIYSILYKYFDKQYDSYSRLFYPKRLLVSEIIFFIKIYDAEEELYEILDFGPWK